MYNCPDRQIQETKPVLSGMKCDEVAWNRGSQKYLWQDTLNGQPVQMLVDMGCTKTVVFADYLNQDCVDHNWTEKILCVHGDMVCYPTVRVEFWLGQ